MALVYARAFFLPPPPATDLLFDRKVKLTSPPRPPPARPDIQLGGSPAVRFDRRVSLVIHTRCPPPFPSRFLAGVNQKFSYSPAPPRRKTPPQPPPHPPF